jgi:hypothetical protein
MFWLRHIILAAVVLLVGGTVILLQQRNDNTPKPEGASSARKPDQGLTDFYEEYRLSSKSPHQEDVGDFVMELNNRDIPLNQRLESMESQAKPSSGRWVGEHKYRTFKAGATLREAITQYAQSEGMQVIWELDQDFIVKNHFQMDDTIVGSLHNLARAIDSNFDGTVRSFFCPRQRSLVITNKQSDYLVKNCSETTS